VNPSILEHFAPQQRSDDQLLAQVMPGDRQAFDDLCVRYNGLDNRPIATRRFRGERFS
jgi:hypothetical protein